MDVSPWWRRGWQVAASFGLLILLGLGGGYSFKTTSRSQATDIPQRPAPRTSEHGRPSDLPLPSRVSVPQFEEKLFDFLNTRRYVKLGWLRDKVVRDTGPYIGGKSYGTHPAVRVYYSPGVIRWLMDGRVGAIPDGEMIIKEQYAAPAIRHRDKTDEELWDSLESWTVMVKDAAGSHDGWFWSNPAKGQCVVDNHQYPFDHPLSGFGLYCVRCHAATRSPGAEPAGAANEFTFASLRNIAGFPGEPILFRVDDSWRDDTPKKADVAPSGDDHHDSHPRCARPELPMRPIRIADQRFLSVFNSIELDGLSEVSHLPPVTHDWVVGGRDRSQGFVTSNQCMGCHAGLVGPFGPSMFVPAGAGAEYGGPGRDVSPYGEWRWTPMGLAGRDPIFYAQLESEIHSLRATFGSDPALARELCETLTDTCLRCHGAMGQRQFDRDHQEPAARFSLDHVHAVAGPTEHPGQGDSKYGALARDGVGCVVCHRMRRREQPPDDRRPYLQYFLESSISGNFDLSEKGEIYGPFKDEEIAPYAMEHATGLKPTHGEFLKSSQLCGTCHTIVLPAVDNPMDSSHPDHRPDELIRSQVVPLFRKFHHHVEQATYLEWLNSEYENEINERNPRARSCQDCHMARGLKDERHGIDLPKIRTRIAAIQDTSYPDAENLAPHDQLHVRTRDEGFRRHNFSGLNVFLLELFDQFDDVLGVAKTNFMTGSKDDIGHAVDDFVRTARDDVASLDVDAALQAPNRLRVHVVVKNKVGHRFPSGVGFRRAFLELSVIQPAEDRREPGRIVWSSGRTNELGVLLGADGQPLPTESFALDPRTGRQRYQEHHDVITSPDQVQVYEMLRRDATGKLTTSFVCGCEVVKDNRLLPRGWKREGPGPALAGRFLEATHPGPGAAEDPRYTDGSGSDEVSYRIDLPEGTDPARLTVRATLYYQATPPYFLRHLFETAPDGPATRRLHSLCSFVNLEGTPIENWKLKITSAETVVGHRP
jgi:hypothetical protein